MIEENNCIVINNIPYLILEKINDKTWDILYKNNKQRIYKYFETYIFQAPLELTEQLKIFNLKFDFD